MARSATTRRRVKFSSRAPFVTKLGVPWLVSFGRQKDMHSQVSIPGARLCHEMENKAKKKHLRNLGTYEQFEGLLLYFYRGLWERLKSSRTELFMRDAYMLQVPKRRQTHGESNGCVFICTSTFSKYIAVPAPYVFHRRHKNAPQHSLPSILVRHDNVHGQNLEKLRHPSKKCAFED